MKPDSIMLLSGFYLDDLPEITEECKKYGLTFIDKKMKKNWVCAKFKFN
jgi:ribosomal protein L11 methyltransferase